MATEEQTSHNANGVIYSTSYTKDGQRLTISNRRVTKLGFWLRKLADPTGDVTFEIRKISPDDVISSKVWGDASALPTEDTYEEVEFDTPQTVNEEVRICADFSGGDGSNFVVVRYQNTDVKGDEYRSQYQSPNWVDSAAQDGAYIYTYEEAAAGLENKSANMGAKMIAGKMI